MIQLRKNYQFNKRQQAILLAVVLGGIALLIAANVWLAGGGSGIVGGTSATTGAQATSESVSLSALETAQN